MCNIVFHIVLLQVEFMKNVAELEDLEDVTNKMIKIAAHVLENTAFRWGVSWNWVYSTESRVPSLTKR